MDDKWLYKIAGKYIRFRQMKTTESFTIRQGWVEDNPKNPRWVTVQLDQDGVEHSMLAVDIQYVQCILKDKTNLHRTVTYLCGGRCPVKGTETYPWSVECQGCVSDPSEYS
jgi:hypothetical protein